MKPNSIAPRSPRRRRCIARAGARQSDEQLWTNFNATVKLSDHWRLSEEVHAPLQRQSQRPLRDRVQHAARLPAEQGGDGVGRLHAQPAICRRRLHRDGAPRPRAGDVRRLRQARQGQAERPYPVRAALARTCRRHRLARPALSQIFASDRRQDRAQPQQRALLQPQHDAVPAQDRASTACATSSPSRLR